jgi:hypothetical protein
MAMDRFGLVDNDKSNNNILVQQQVHQMRLICTSDSIG